MEQLVYSSHGEDGKLTCEKQLIYRRAAMLVEAYGRPSLRFCKHKCTKTYDSKVSFIKFV